MVAPTEQRQVRERGRPAVGPVANVMALAEREAAAREAATFVAVVEHAPERGRNRPGTGADLFDPAIRSVPHHHPARVARQAPRRFRGNVRAVLEDRLPRTWTTTWYRSPGAPDRSCGEGLSRRAGPARPPAAGSAWAFPRERLLGRRSSRSPAPADTAPRGPRRAPARAALRSPAPAGRGRPPCRPRRDTRAARGSHGAARFPGPRPAGPPVATRERSAPRAPRCRASRPAAAAPRSRAGPPGSGRGPWSTTALRAPVSAPAAAGCRARAPRARARPRRPGRARPATSASRRRTGSRCSSRRGRQTRGSDRAGGRWRRRGVRRARRSRRRGGPAPRRSRRWVQNAQFWIRQLIREARASTSGGSYRLAEGRRGRGALRLQSTLRGPRRGPEGGCHGGYALQAPGRLRCDPGGRRQPVAAADGGSTTWAVLEASRRRRRAARKTAPDRFPLCFRRWPAVLRRTRHEAVPSRARDR